MPDREWSDDAAAMLFGKPREPEPDPDPGADQHQPSDKQPERITGLPPGLIAERRRAEQTHEQRLAEDVARFQAEGNVEAAAIAAAELKQVRQVPEWLR